MKYSIEPLKHDDINTFIEVWWKSFAPPEVDQVLPQIYPGGLTPALKERLRTRIMLETDGDTVEYCFVARDDDSKQIVGVSWWKQLSKPVPLNSEEEAQKEHKEQLKNKNVGPPVEGQNVELGDAFYSALYHSERNTIKAKQVPYIALSVLGVLPEYARNFIGSGLLEHGLERVDELNVWTYVVASSTGRGLYSKYGFDVVNEFDLDCTKYGGRSKGAHCDMLRPPQH